MITSIIIDDELNSIKALLFELNEYPSRIEVIEQFTKASEAMAFLKTHEVDVIFLDVEMPEMNGLDFLEQHAERDFQVVFITAYSKYALEAIQQEAIYYLLKPIDSEELGKCIERIEKNLSSGTFERKLDVALGKLNQKEETPKRIKLLYNGKILLCQPHEILYCKGEGNYCWVFFSDGKKLMLSKKLKEVESVLYFPMFFRVHNSFIVNLNKIQAYNKKEGFLIIGDNVYIPVSRSKRAEILDKI